MFVPIKKLVPSYLKVSSPFNVVPPSLVMTLFPEALLIVTCDGIALQVAALPEPPLVHTCPDVP